MREVHPLAHERDVVGQEKRHLGDEHGPHLTRQVEHQLVGGEAVHELAVHPVIDAVGIPPAHTQPGVGAAQRNVSAGEESGAAARTENAGRDAAASGRGAFRVLSPRTGLGECKRGHPASREAELALPTSRRSVGPPWVLRCPPWVHRGFSDVPPLALLWRP